MGGFKMGAHPLVVAVAMGLLGPGAVLDEREQRLTPTSKSVQVDEEAPSAEDFARVEDLWHEVRELI